MVWKMNEWMISSTILCNVYGLFTQLAHTLASVQHVLNEVSVLILKSTSAVILITPIEVYRAVRCKPYSPATCNWLYKPEYWTQSHGHVTLGSHGTEPAWASALSATVCIQVRGSQRPSTLSGRKTTACVCVQWRTVLSGECSACSVPWGACSCTSESSGIFSIATRNPLETRSCATEYRLLGSDWCSVGPWWTQVSEQSTGIMGSSTAMLTVYKTLEVTPHCFHIASWDWKNCSCSPGWIPPLLLSAISVLAFLWECFMASSGWVECSVIIRVPWQTSTDGMVVRRPQKPPRDGKEGGKTGFTGATKWVTPIRNRVPSQWGF